MVSYVNAQGLGKCNLGSYTLGNCILSITITSPTVSVGGGGCSFGTFDFNDRCIDNSFRELLNFLNQSLLSQWVQPSQGVLFYILKTPLKASTGDTIEIINLLENEGDLPTEVNCINFIDINKNSLIDNEEPITMFNKRVFPKQDNEVSTFLLIPETESGSYLLGGKCDLIDSNFPDATTANKIIITKRTKIDFSLSRIIIRNSLITLVLTILLGVLIYKYIQEKTKKEGY